MNWKKGIAVALSAITVMAMVAGCGSNTTTSVDGLASKGFKDGENIKIDQQNAQADQSNLNSIAQRFVSDKKDLVLAIATPAAQTMANASHDMPILGTAITDYVTAKLVQSNEHPGGNVTGTYSVDYYKLGYQTGLMAAKVLSGEAKVRDMAIETQKDIKLTVNEERAKKLGITIPDALRKDMK